MSWDDDNSRLTWTDQNSVGQSITNVTFDFATQEITYTRADNTTFTRSFAEINNFHGVAGDGFTGDETFRAGDSAVVGSIFYLYFGTAAQDFSPATILAAQFFIHLPALDAAGLMPSNLLALGGGTGQVLTRTATGQAWQTPIQSTGLLVVHSDETLDGDGTTADPIGLANAAIEERHVDIGNTPVDGYVLSWDAANTRFLWKIDATAAPDAGLDQVHHDARFTGTGASGTPLGMADDAVDTPQLAE